MGQVISFTSRDVYEKSHIGNLVTDGYLYRMYKDTHSVSFGLDNGGSGYRDYFRAGNISYSDVISVIPFENSLVEVSISGTELKELYLEGTYPLSGVIYIEGTYKTLVDWQWKEIINTEYYKGIMCDYLWYVQYKDRWDGFDTGFHYRQAVVDYINDTIDDLSLHQIIHHRPVNRILRLLLIIVIKSLLA
ncbi:MAG: 5'-nucleotidase C-terminal domain-containing protein [Candidatus Heimdallarchaeota archaeon]|nr:5'-nucleotidase C-terminal domain-containing protein [Candidatus Heimdallarchaeota archaeon]